MRAGETYEHVHAGLGGVQATDGSAITLGAGAAAVIGLLASTQAL